MRAEDMHRQLLRVGHGVQFIIEKFIYDAPFAPYVLARVNAELYVLHPGRDLTSCSLLIDALQRWSTNHHRAPCEAVGLTVEVRDTDDYQFIMNVLPSQAQAMASFSAFSAYVTKKK